MSYTGSCNQCGRCCQAWIRNADSWLVANCENLRWKGLPGEALSSYCAVHETREVGMPIRLVHLGKVVGESVCVANYPRPQDAIPPECSFVWAGEKSKQPQYVQGKGPDLNPHEV